MITEEEAVQALLSIAQGKYIPGASYTCVHKFVASFPKKEQVEFVPEKLAPRGGFEPPTCGLTVRRSTD